MYVDDVTIYVGMYSNLLLRCICPVSSFIVQ